MPEEGRRKLKIPKIFRIQYFRVNLTTSFTAMSVSTDFLTTITASSFRPCQSIRSNE